MSIEQADEMEQLLNGINTDQFYQRYKSVGQSPMLISAAALMNLVAIPGFFMNLAIIFVTLKYRSLRVNTSSFLLALTAAYECLHVLGHLLFLYVALSGLNFVPYWLCFRFLLLPFVANMASVCSIAITGLDRLLHLTFPKWCDLNGSIYLLAYFGITFGAGIANGYRYWRNAQQIGDYPQTGHIGDILPGSLGQWHLVYMLGCNGAGICCYLAIWVILRVKTNSQSIHRHLLKCMAVIVGINIGGYLVNALLRICLGPLLPLDAVGTWLLNTYLGIALNFCVSLNAAVLYVCSSEYRACFRAEWAALGKLVFKGNKVQTIFPSQLPKSNKSTVSVQHQHHQHLQLQQHRLSQQWSNSRI